jgi:hypothetical protein
MVVIIETWKINPYDALLKAILIFITSKFNVNVWPHSRRKDIG